MTETLSGVSSMPKEAKKKRSSSMATVEERAAIAQLVRAARARGEDLTGPEGLLKSITATVLETALEEWGYLPLAGAMTEHVGHAKHRAPEGGAPTWLILLVREFRPRRVRRGGLAVRRGWRGRRSVVCR